MSDQPLPVPDDLRFDVSAAARALVKLADVEPDARIAVTLARLGAGGLEAESDVYLSAGEAAALLSAVGEDQRLTAGDPELVVLRVGRASALPETGTPERDLVSE